MSQVATIAVHGRSAALEASASIVAEQRMAIVACMIDTHKSQNIMPCVFSARLRACSSRAVERMREMIKKRGAMATAIAVTMPVV